MIRYYFLAVKIVKFSVILAGWLAGFFSHGIITRPARFFFSFLEWDGLNLFGGSRGEEGLVEGKAGKEKRTHLSARKD